jgi:hypothetical protein
MLIAVAVAATILVLRIRDAIVSMSQVVPVSGGSVSSASPERKMRERFGWKPSSVAIWLMPPLIESVNQYPNSEV